MITRQGVPVQAAVLCAALVLTGCTTLPAGRAAPPAIPAEWQDAPSSAALPVTDWWRGFEDPLLDQLVGEALAQGPSVELAAARVREARAYAQSALAVYLPEVLATGSLPASRIIDGPVPEGAGRSQMSAVAGAQVSWEVPLFAIDPARTGAEANTATAVADLHGAQAALAADVAQAYVDLRTAQASRAALLDAVDISDSLARILEVSSGAGFASEADAADARRLAESTRARLPDLVIEERRAQNVLAILRGRVPGTEDESIAQRLGAADAPLPVLYLVSAPAAPADLLRLRPDIARAEAQTLVAAAQLGAARADMLPKLNLSGTITASEALAGNPADAGTALANLVPFVSIPLFDWGRRQAVAGQRTAQLDQALIQYHQTVIEAVADASFALVSLDQAQLRRRATRAAEDAAAQTADGARAAYGAGIQSLTDRLRAEQQLIDARLARISAEAALAAAAIAVYRAFGGGPAIGPERLAP